MNVWIIYRRDRFLRASDHVPFLDRRYPANRFTEPNEDFRQNVTTFTVKGITKDNFLFGVKAVDRDGHRSVVSFPTP